MADKDFKVKNKLIVKGISSAGPLTIDASGNVDSTSYIPTQYGGTGTSTSPTSGQILYSSAGTNYAPTTLTSLSFPVSYTTSEPTSPIVGQVWVDSDSDSLSFDPNIIRRHTFTATAGQTNFVASVNFVDGYEQVYFNGLLLLRSTDYTTSGNNTVILTSAAAENDIIEIVAITNLNSVNTYTQAEIDTALAAKLSTSTAASTYLTQSNASSTYLTQSNASSTYLTQSNASSTYAAKSNPTFTAIGGDEGGQINLGAAATNTTLSGPISLDIYQNRLRVFEGGGNNRGAYVDLSTLSNGVGSELIAASPQSGNSGKYLTTNGTNATWATVSSGGITQLSNTSVSGSQIITLSNIFGGGYKQILIVGNNLKSSPNDAFISIRVSTSSNTGMDSTYSGINAEGSSTPTLYGFRASSDNYNTITKVGQSDLSTCNFKFIFHAIDLNTNYVFSEFVSTSGSLNRDMFITGWHRNGPIYNCQIRNDQGNFNGGNIAVYGIK